MSESVFIVHPSAIIREGLYAVLRNIFPGHIVRFENWAQVPHHVRAICFIDSENWPRQVQSGIRLIAICYGAVSSQSCPNAAGFLDIMAPVDTIQESFKVFSVRFAKPHPTHREGLSTRETEVLALVARGFSNKEISARLFISTHTVISHRKNITGKLGIKSVPGLTLYAVINKLVDFEDIRAEYLL